MDSVPNSETNGPSPQGSYFSLVSVSGLPAGPSPRVRAGGSVPQILSTQNFRLRGYLGTAFAEVKVRSYWSRGALNPMTVILIKRGNRDTDVYRGKLPK